MSTDTESQFDSDLEILDSNQAAEVLGLSVDALRKRISRGTVDGFKSNGRWYVRNSDVKTDIIALLRQQIEVKDHQIRELHSMLATAQQSAFDASVAALLSAKTPWWKFWRKSRKAAPDKSLEDRTILVS